MQASDCAAKASLSSMRSSCPRLPARPAPAPSSTPAPGRCPSAAGSRRRCRETKRASGVLPPAPSTACSLISSTAEAPSLSVDELPGRHACRRRGRRPSAWRASPATESARGPSSCAHHHRRALLLRRSPPAPARRRSGPPSARRRAFWCEASAKASCSSRAIFHCSATFSAVSPICSRGNSAASFGFGKRQPSEVSKTSHLPLGKPSAGLGMRPRRAGHRLHAAGHHHVGLAQRIMRAPWMIASSPLPHSRLTVAAGTDVGQPGQQHRHARHVAVVLAGLVGAAEVHLVHLLARHAGAREHRA